MGVDVESLEGWLNKDKKLNGYRLGITGTQTKRWFRVQYIDGGGRFLRNGAAYKNLVLCYFKHKSTREPHGWMFLKDVTNVREVTPKCFVVEHPSRSYVLRAVDSTDHRRWVDGLQRLVEEAHKMLGEKEKSLSRDSANSDHQQRTSRKRVDDGVEPIGDSSPTASSPSTKSDDDEKKDLRNRNVSFGFIAESSDHRGKGGRIGEYEVESRISGYEDENRSASDGLKMDNRFYRTSNGSDRGEEKDSVSYDDDRQRPETKQSFRSSEEVDSFKVEETAQQRKARERAEIRRRKFEASSKETKCDEMAGATMRSTQEKYHRVGEDDDGDFPEFDDEIDLALEDERKCRLGPVAPPERRKQPTLKKETTNAKSTQLQKQQRHMGRQETCVSAAKILRRGAGGDELDVDFGPPRRKKGPHKSALARRLEQGKRPERRIRQVEDDSSDEDIEKTVAAERARLRNWEMATIRQESLRRAHQVTAERKQQQCNEKNSPGKNRIDGASTSVRADRDFVTAKWDDDYKFINKSKACPTGGIIADADYLQDWDE